MIIIHPLPMTISSLCCKLLLPDRRGKTGGLDSNQIDNLLVDFDRKRDDDSSQDSSDEEDESTTVPLRLLDEEVSPSPWVHVSFAVANLVPSSSRIL